MNIAPIASWPKATSEARGSRDHPGGGPKRAGTPCDRKPRQGGSRRANLGPVRARPSASCGPVRQTRGPALRLLLGGLHGQRQSRSRGRSDMGADAPFRGRRRDRDYRILSAEGRRPEQRVTPQSARELRRTGAMNNNQMREGNSMAERGAGQRSWPLSPYEVNVSFARTNAAGERANWFGPLTPITPLAPPEVAGRQWDYPAGYNLSTLRAPSSPLPFRRCARSPTVMIFCVLSSRHERIRPRANRGASSRGIMERIPRRTRRVSRR